MGDRTTVYLIVPISRQQEVQQVHKQWAGSPPEVNWIRDNQIQYYEYDVNYGRLPYLEDLAERGILFDQEYDAGCEYGPGCTHGRINKNDEFIITDVQDISRNPDFPNLMNIVRGEGAPQQKYLALAEYLIKHEKNNLSLPWDSVQEERMAQYQTLRLIGTK